VQGRQLAAAATLAVALLAPMAPAMAADGSGEPTPPVTQPEREEEPRAPGIAEPATLPFTGSELTGFVLAGAAAIGGGAALLRRTRVRKAEL
jgi:LPXTG-motif cell wall-anchored protein